MVLFFKRPNALNIDLHQPDARFVQEYGFHGQMFRLIPGAFLMKAKFAVISDA